VKDFPPGVPVLAVGGQHTCALIDNLVRCWGNNYSGQLGDASKTNRSLPASPVQFE